MTTLFLAALLAQASPSNSPPPPKPAVVVHIKMFAFTPATVRVKPGETIEFINDDGDAHTVTSSKKLFDSGGLDTHDTWFHAFKDAGTFAYICSLHPYMKGVIIVSPASK
jgi:plastocyanin